MVYMESLNKKNISILESLTIESLKYNPYKENAYKKYLDSNILKKIFYKRSILLLKWESNYVGYIYFEVSGHDTLIIKDLYINHNYINKVNIFKLSRFKNKIIIYQTFDDELTKKILNSNNFTQSKITKLMNISLYNKKYSLGKSNLSFKKVENDFDRKIRCKLQNEIFNHNNRVPIKIKDIKYEESQNYYLKDLATFLVLNNEEIGYGQIIFNKNMYTVVNFGIEENYRSLGYGEEFLKYIMNRCIDSNIKDLFIRVDIDNFKAYNLYIKLGFKYIGTYSTWIKANYY